jgi:hypothetical protein
MPTQILRAQILFIARYLKPRELDIDGFGININAHKEIDPPNYSAADHPAA